MKIGDFKNIHKGERCFIVCNGPHLNDIDPSLLDNEITFGMNRIYLKPEMKIDYLFVVDMRIKEQWLEEIVQAPAKVVFSNVKGRDDIVYVGITRHTPRKFVYDLENEETGRGSGVVYFALQIAYWMGCDPVYIVGMDHEYKLDNARRNHAREVIATGPDINHFHPEYFPEGCKWSCAEGMEDRFAEGFKLAADAYAENGRTLLNASTVTKLSEDIIQRIDFYDII